ncbi:MAG: hypothetical protein ABI625_21175 [bacterium]
MTEGSTAGNTRFRQFELVWACLLTGFFLYTALVWRHVLGTGNEWRPAGTALLTGALAAQAVGSAIGRRFPRLRWLQWTLIATAVAALWFSVQAR